MLAHWKETYNKSRHWAKRKRYHFANKHPYIKAIIFPVAMYWCEIWTIKKTEHQELMLSTVLLDKTLESSLECKEIKPVNPKGNQLWIFTRRTNAVAEAPILWTPDAKSWLTGKDSNAGNAWGQEENGVTKNAMVGWHHRLNGHKFEQTWGGRDGEGMLACCNPRVHKESNTI